MCNEQQQQPQDHAQNDDVEGQNIPGVSPQARMEQQQGACQEITGVSCQYRKESSQNTTPTAPQSQDRQERQ